MKIEKQNKEICCLKEYVKRHKNIFADSVRLYKFMIHTDKKNIEIIKEVTTFRGQRECWLWVYDNSEKELYILKNVSNCIKTQMFNTLKEIGLNVGSIYTM